MTRITASVLALGGMGVAFIGFCWLVRMVANESEGKALLMLVNPVSAQSLPEPSKEGGIS